MITMQRSKKGPNSASKTGISSFLMLISHTKFQDPAHTNFSYTATESVMDRSTDPNQYGPELLRIWRNKNLKRHGKKHIDLSQANCSLEFMGYLNISS